MKRLALIIFVTSLLATQTAFAAGPPTLGGTNAAGICEKLSESDPGIIVTVVQNNKLVAKVREPRNGESPAAQAAEVASKVASRPNFPLNGVMTACENGKSVLTASFGPDGYAVKVNR